MSFIKQALAESLTFEREEMNKKELSRGMVQAIINLLIMEECSISDTVCWRIFLVISLMCITNTQLLRFFKVIYENDN